MVRGGGGECNCQVLHHFVWNLPLILHTISGLYMLFLKQVGFQRIGRWSYLFPETWAWKLAQCPTHYILLINPMILPRFKKRDLYSTSQGVRVKEFVTTFNHHNIHRPDRSWICNSWSEDLFLINFGIV